MLRFRFPQMSAARGATVLVAAVLTLSPAAALAQIAVLGDIADILKSDAERFNADVAKINQDYKKFNMAQDLLDKQSKLGADLFTQTAATIRGLQAEVTAFEKKRPGLSPEKWGDDDDARKDRQRHAELRKKIQELEAFRLSELSNCREAVRAAKQYTGTARLTGDIGTISGTDQTWTRIKDRVNATITRCNEAANRVKQLQASSQQVILASPADPLRIENKSDKMVFYILGAGGADGTRIGPNETVRVAMPADRILRVRAEAQTPMRENILLLGQRGGKTITVETKSQHELTYTARAGDSTGRTSTRVTSEVCTWKVSSLSTRVAAQTATPTASGRYPTLKDDAVAWTIPPITRANFSAGISEPLMAATTCNLEWLYERTGTGAFGSKTERTSENQYGTVTVWVMPQ